MDMPVFQNITYERPSIEEFKECAMRVRLKIMTARSAEHIESALTEFQKEYSRFETAVSVCMIRHDADVKDEFYLEEMRFFEETSAIVAELVSSIFTALLNVEHISSCKEKFGEMIFLKAQNKKESISKDIVDLLVREAALKNQYGQLISSAEINFKGSVYNLSTIEPFTENIDRNTRREAEFACSQFYSEQKEQMDQIFQEMVEIRTSMAQILGYENFVELGYKRMERYDYTPDMVKNFREMILQYVVPVTVEIRRLQEERLGQNALKYYDLKNLFARGNPEPDVDVSDFTKAASRMFQSIFETDPSFFDVLSSHGFTDIIARQNKSSGGYCTTILDYGIPYIFMNANKIAGDVTTLIHESGHAYAAIRSVDSSPFIECISPTLEACEIHSTAMEYLSYPFIEYFFGKKSEAYREMHMTQSLLFLPYGCMVDEFQHIIYENPAMSPAERDIAWRDLEKKYQPFLDYDGIPFYENGGAWQKKMHIFTDPFYYIDYCLAQITALEIWDISRKDYKKALQQYDQFCMEGGNSAFLDLLARAQLSSPFEKDTVKRVIFQACSFLKI